MIKGCDLSQWQGQPDFSSLQKQVSFALIRSTYGNGYTDPQFIRNQSEARRVGLLLGYYHYSYPQLNSAVDEANWVLSVLKDKIQAGESIYLDWEEKYTGDIVSWCKTFLDTISIALDYYKPLIYLNLSEVNGYNWKPIIDAGYGLWLADYDNISDNTPNTPWPVVAMKQYSSSGSLAGVSGNVDIDTFFGDTTAFKAYGYKPNISTSVVTVSPAIPNISDQTKYDFGDPYGVQELQAVRSMLHDKDKALQAQDNQIKTQASTIADLNIQTTSLAEELGNCQNSRLAVSKVVEPKVPPVIVSTASDTVSSSVWADNSILGAIIRFFKQLKGG